MTAVNVFFHSHEPESKRQTELPLTLVSVWYGRTLNIHIDLVERPNDAETDFVVQGFRAQDPQNPALINWQATTAYRCVLPSFGPPNQWTLLQQERAAQRQLEREPATPEVIQYPFQQNQSRGRSLSAPSISGHYENIGFVQRVVHSDNSGEAFSPDSFDSRVYALSVSQHTRLDHLNQRIEQSPSPDQFPCSPGQPSSDEDISPLEPPLPAIQLPLSPPAYTQRLDELNELLLFPRPNRVVRSPVLDQFPGFSPEADSSSLSTEFRLSETPTSLSFPAVPNSTPVSTRSSIFESAPERRSPQIRSKL
jgi:hypothetical protein